MHKFFLPLFLSLFTPFNGNAQDSLLNNNGNGISNSAAPLLTINAEDIKRFPGGNFMDAVEGLFPWVLGVDQQPGEFLYIVNGNLLQDVNSICLNDIEAIAFTRNNLYGGLVPFSKAGTFFITTKQASEKPGLKFSSQFNMISNRQQPLVPASTYDNYNSKIISNDIRNGYGNNISNHFSFSQSGKKYSLYTGVYFNSNKLPGSAQAVSWFANPDTASRNINAATKNQLQTYGGFADFNYRLSSKVQAGIMVSYRHTAISIDSSKLQSTGFSDSYDYISVNAPFNKWSAAVFLKWQPIPHLSTKLSVEYINSKFTSAGNEHWGFNVDTSFNSKTEVTHAVSFKEEGILLRNELKYDFSTKGRFKAGIDLNTLWYKPVSEMNDAENRVSNTNSYYQQAFWWKVTEKTGVVNPALHFSYNEMISGYAGAGYLIGGQPFNKVKGSEKINPYGGIDLNLKNIFETGSQIDALHLSFDFSKLAANYSAATPSSLIDVVPAIHLAGHNTAAGVSLDKTTSFSLKLTGGFLKSRLLIALEWSRLKYDKQFLYLINIYPNGYYYTTAPGYETSEGFSLFVSATLIDKKAVKLYSRLNFLVPHTMSHPAFGTAMNSMDDAGLKAGIQNKLLYKKYFLQLNMLLNFNHRYSPSEALVKVTKNDFVVNNLLLGYQVPATTGILKNSVFFVQARNLFISKALKEQYLYNGFVGVGFDLAF